MLMDTDSLFAGSEVLTAVVYMVISSEVEVNLRPIVSRPVCLDVRRPSGTFDQFFFLLEISFRQLGVCYFVAPSLTLVYKEQLTNCTC
jgi:hypothetical protein